MRIPVDYSETGLVAGGVEIHLGGKKKNTLSKATLAELGEKPDSRLRLQTCVVCNGWFVADYTAKTCSDKCARKNQKAWRDAHRPAPKPSKPQSKATLRVAALAAASCLECGQPFEAKRLTARFCSGKCRQKHYRGLLEKTRSLELTMFSDAKARKNRFAICDSAGNPLWFGKFFDNDRDYDGEQSSGELAAAKKAVWLASKIREAAGSETIRLTLKVDAEWLTYANDVAAGEQSGGKARDLGFAARRLCVELNVEWVQGKSNPADKYTVGSGFKSWKDNDLKALARSVWQAR